MQKVYIYTNSFISFKFSNFLDRSTIIMCYVKNYSIFAIITINKYQILTFFLKKKIIRESLPKYV